MLAKYHLGNIFKNGLLVLTVALVVGASVYEYIKYHPFPEPQRHPLIGRTIYYEYPSYDKYKCVGYECGLIGLEKSNGKVIWVSPCGRTAIRAATDKEELEEGIK